MQKKTNQKLSFDQFLLSYFGIKKSKDFKFKKESHEAENAYEFKYDKFADNVAGQRLYEKPEATEDSKFFSGTNASKKASHAYLFEQKHKSNKETKLEDAINHIQDEERSFAKNEYAHKHESEWYHTYCDMKDSLAQETAKKNSHHEFKLKTEIKELVHHIDDAIESVLFRFEKVFHIFPTASRVAVIYLLALVISLPLVFVSLNNKTTVKKEYLNANNPVSQNNTPDKIEMNAKTREILVKNNSYNILQSGKEVVTIVPGTKQGRVAGAYEENKENNLILNKILLGFDKITEMKQDLNHIFAEYIRK